MGNRLYSDDLDKGGRPLKFKTVEELEKQIDAYFASLYDYARDMWGNRLKDKDYQKPADGSDDNNPYAGWVMKKVKVATVTGLAVYLDTTRETLMNYESGAYDDRDADGNAIELSDTEQLFNEQVNKFSDTIKRAKAMIYDDTEQQLYKSGASTGAIFSLKNNYGWRDKVEHDLNNPDGNLNPFGKLTVEELRKIAEG